VKPELPATAANPVPNASDAQTVAKAEPPATSVSPTPPVSSSKTEASPTPASPAAKPESPADAAPKTTKKSARTNTAAAPKTTPKEVQPPKPPADPLAVFTGEIQRLGSRVLGPSEYPAEAKEKAWEGTSQVEVRFASGGYIRNIIVGDSTGHMLLDEKALEWARSLQYPDVPAELRERDFTVSFPVVFRLR